MTETNVTKLGRWGTQGALALADQGLFSGANFLVNVFLARSLDPESYGAFAVAFSALLFLGGFHNSLLLEPVSIFGPAKYSDRLAAYFSRQTKLHFLISVPLALILIATGVTALVSSSATSLGQALAGAGVAFPFIFLLYAARRFQYVLRRPSRAAVGSGLYLILAMGGMAILHFGTCAGPLGAYWVLAISSLVPSIVLLQGKIEETGSEPLSNCRVLLNEQWEFGRWQMVAGILMTGAVQVQTYLTAGYLGLKSAAALRAMEMGMLPMAQAVIAIAALGLPILARDFGRGDMAAMRRKAFLMTVGLTVVALTYEAVLFFARNPLERLLYGGKYAEYAWLTPLLGVVPILSGLAVGHSLMLRAAQKPRHYLVQAAIVAPFGVGTAIVFTRIWGLFGASLSLICTYAISTLVILCLCRVWLPRQTRGGIRSDPVGA